MVAGLVGAFGSEGDCSLRQGWVVVGLCSGVFMYGVEDESFSSFDAVVEKQIVVAFTRRGGGWDSAWDPTGGMVMIREIVDCMDKRFLYWCQVDRWRRHGEAFPVGSPHRICFITCNPKHLLHLGSI